LAHKCCDTVAFKYYEQSRMRHHQLRSTAVTADRKDCPTKEQFRAFVAGDLPEQDYEDLSMHLEVCQRCDETVKCLEAETGTQIPRLSNSPTYTNEDAYLEAMRRLRGESDPAAARAYLSSLSEMPASIGAYQLLEAVGQGGMGTVYRAMHSGIKRVVALKLLHARTDKHAVERFQREAEVLGRLRHANVVTVSDAGYADGHNYIAMEYLDGADLARIIRAVGPMEIADACEIVAQAAVGLQYAHDNDTIHRDIKPSNLMVTAAGQVKILDLGLARFCDSETVSRGLTVSGQIMGSVDYMAPEHLDNSSTVDSRTDIYSLGATLYTLLTGQTPYDCSKYKSTQQKLVALARIPVEDVRSLRSEVPRKLAKFVQRMLAKRPEHRIQTAGEAAQTLRAFAGSSNERLAQLVERTQQFPPDAEPRININARQRPAKKSVRRFVLGGGMVFSFVVAVLALANFGTVVRIVTNQGELIVHYDQAEVDLKVEITQGRQTIKVLDLKNGSSVRLTAGNYGIRLSGAGSKGLRLDSERVTLRRGSREIVKVEFEPAAMAAGRDVVASHFGRHFPTPEIETEAEIYGLAVSPDGARFVTAGVAPQISVWRADSSVLERTLSGHEAHVNAVAFAPHDSDLLASADDLGVIRMWDLSDRARPTREFTGHTGFIKAIAFTHDGSQLVTTGGDRTVRIWDLNDNSDSPRILTGHEHEALSVCVSPNGRYLLSGNHAGKLLLWDLGSEHEPDPVTVSAHRGRVEEIKFAPSGEMFATVGGWPDDQVVKLWSIEEGVPRERTVLSGHEKWVISVAFSPDGKLLASGSDDNTVRLWDLTQNKPETLMTFRTHGGKVEEVAFSPDGNRLYSAGSDGRIFLHEITHVELARLSRSPFLVSTGYDGTMKFWDVDRRSLRYTLPSTGKALERVALDAQGRLLATTGHDGIARTWNLSYGRREAEYDLGFSLEPLALSADGRLLAVAGTTGEVHLIDQSSSQRRQLTTKGKRWSILSLAFSPDGSRLASGDAAGSVHVYDVESGAELRTFESEYTGDAACVRFSPDGKLLLAAVPPSRVVIWDANEGALVDTLDAENPIERVALSPDGQMLAVACNGNGLAVLFDLKQHRKQVLDHPEGVWGVAFNQDGSMLATGCMDGKVRLWDASTGDFLHAFEGHQGWVTSVAFAGRSQ
jgi:WD40 repeat protein/serine/threonine protein kinase